jgi:hypothetical protein
MKNFCKLSVGMKNFCKLSVEGLKFVDLMVNLAGFVEENGMDRGGRILIGESIDTVE